MSIPMVAIGPDDDAERESWIAALTRTIDNTAFCLGPEVEAFEARCQEFLEVPYAIGVNSGTDAIRIGLQALGVGVGDEVIVPAMSFFASASSIAHLGATPIFVDVEPETLTIDVAQVEAKLTDRTKAIMPVHLYGQGADLRALSAVAEKAGVAILEDAAQCFDARYRMTDDDNTGQALGSIGACGAFSFYVTKNLAAAGDAGMIITRDEALYEKMKRLRVHGDAGGYQHDSLGWNARMDGFQGAILALRLERLRDLHAARAENACRYHEAITARGAKDDIRPLAVADHSDHVWHQYIVRLPDRDRIMAKLREQGIGCAIYYPTTLPSQPAFAGMGNVDESFPHAEAACGEVLGLPIHHRLKPEDPARVIDAIVDALP